MAQTEEGQNRASQQPYLSIPSSNFSTDLLQRLVSHNHFSEKSHDPKEEEEDADEIELSLGLSLNGRFGVDPRAKNRLSLKRSSSISDFTTTNPSGEDITCRHVTPANAAAACPAPLTRACSLPTETEEEWRKRKELQTLRRMEAKRKRSEKHRNLKAARDRSSRAPAEENGGEDDRGGANGSRQSQERSLKVVDEFSSMAVPAGWVSGGNDEKDNGPVVSGGLDGLTVPTQPSFPGSMASHGSGSSGISESNSLAGQGHNAGVNKCPEVMSPAGLQSLPERVQKLAIPGGPLTREKSGGFDSVVTENQSSTPAFSRKGAKEIVRNVLEDMPCVSTTGVGPNGKRIEGFLYRYRKDEEVRIVCVCHGSFLSPAEFVKHAGGGDADHPLKHIVVNPTSFL
ncbi:Ninja family [Trema orientale]|uniref:Ninja-family protein n=1 Tax=Trema orientale TaxID=63057 RepID=A0A2P5DK15_TREOI|nr:Ninja family [Trema orientale]